MKTFPIHHPFHAEPTQKEFWLAAYVSILQRLPPEGAIKEADEALRLVDIRWRNPEFVESWQYAHSYPLGHVFFKEKQTSDDTDSAST